MTISSTIKSQIESGSWIRKMFEEGALLKKKYGEENVFDLSLGNPIMEPPEEFFEQLQYLASNPKPGLHRYMPTSLARAQSAFFRQPRLRIRSR